MQCEGERHKKWIAQEIIGQGGEGIILQKIGSFYEGGRSMSLVKLKVFLSSFSFFYIVINEI